MDQFSLLAPIVALHLVLTALPGVAAVLWAARGGLRDHSVLLAVGMVGSGLSALLSFWSFFAAPAVGHVCAYAIPASSVFVLVRYRRSLGPGTALVWRLITPVVLWSLGTVFLVFFGFLKGETRAPIATATTRFSHQLPSDNYLPLFFADALFVSGHEGPPAHFYDWLSSDRPPLQSGFVLAERLFEWADPALHYQVLGVALQQLWIVGLWSLLVAMRLPTVTRALVLVALLLSDVAIVNGFFVWPKLLSAAYLLASAAFVLGDRWRSVRRDLACAVLVASLFALALLSHGGSVFGIIPLIIVAAVRGMPTARWVATGVLVGFFLLVPWSLYQRYEDPPGNRLVKWMLSGVHSVDDRSSFQALNDSYGAAGIRGTFQNKVGNFRTMLGGEEVIGHMLATVAHASSGRLGRAVRQVRFDRFFVFLQSLGVFALALPIMFVMRERAARNREEWTFALRCLGCTILGCLAWGIILFGDPETRAVLHAGSFALPLLALAGCVSGLSAVSRKLAVWVVGFHSFTALALYMPVLDPMPGTRFSLVSTAVAMTALACFALVVFRFRDESTAEP